MIPLAKLRFPAESRLHKYNLIHFRFFVQHAMLANVDVELVPSDDQVFVANDKLVFSCTVNDQQIIVDYADHSTKNWKNLYPDLPYFKFQTTQKNSQDLIPLGPPMVGIKRSGSKGATLREYNRVRKFYDYVPGTAILCKQLPNGAAVDRRNHVHQMLLDNLTDVDVLANSSQKEFWTAHKNCLSAVCVPGATNNMVDRGHMELLGLGVCTISPELYTVFPGNIKLTPDHHYYRCADDYSDLLDIIEHLKNNPDRCKEIGNNARIFYEDYYAPRKYWQWILRNLND